jgi:ABC-type bacteriocin/lantibiotic exporter with double-glycine peptidase domain
VILYAVGASVVGLAIPVTIQALVNTIAFGALVQPLFVLATMVLLGLSIGAVFRALQTRLVEAMQERIFARNALAIAERLPEVAREALEGKPDLAARFFDVVTLQKSAAGLLIDGVALALQTMVGMTILAVYHPFLLGFDAILLATMIFVLGPLGRGAVRTAIDESYKKYATAAFLNELASTGTIFRTEQGAKLAQQRAFKLVSGYLTARRAHFRVLFRQHVGALALQVVLGALLIVVGGLLVMNKQLTLGQLVAAELIVSGVLVGFSKVGKQLEALYDMLAALDKIEVLTELPREVGGKGGLLPRAVGDGRSVTGAALTFREVTLRHGARTFLDACNLHVNSGEHLCILGKNGVGKSHVAELIYGLRMPTSGYVELDGETQHTVSKRAWRRDVALVTRGEIFRGTLLENLLVDPDGGDNERAAAQEVLRRVALWERVKDLPEGLDTPLSPRGPELSAGEAVKLVVARALLADPRLVVVDEAVDDIDDDARTAVIDALFHFGSRRTVILITHDAAVAARASRVLRLSEGNFQEVAS